MVRKKKKWYANITPEGRTIGLISGGFLAGGIGGGVGIAVGTVAGIGTAIGLTALEKYEKRKKRR